MVQEATEATEGEVLQEEASGQEKCTKLPALNVVMNVKFHSNQAEIGQYTAEIVFQREELNKAYNL